MSTERNTDAESERLTAMTQVPELEDWGFEGYGDAPPAAGGGIGAFYWFRSQDALLSFLARHLTTLNPPRTDLDIRSLDGAVASAIQRFGADSNLAGLRSELNGITRGTTHLRWVGRLRDLVEGDEEFEREVRSTFRGEEEDANSAPIEPSEMDEFRRFLVEEWSIS